jgi:hypothetical protein
LDFQPAASIPEFDNSYKIIENKYYNKVFHFGFGLPNSDWEISPVEGVDSLLAFRPQLSLAGNLNVIAKMFRRDKMDTLSIIRIGIIPLDEPRISDSIARQSLEEIKKLYPSPDTLRPISNVTVTGASKLRGAYYLLESPNSVKKKYQLLLGMFIVQNRMCYAIFCELKNDAYDFLKFDIENILKSFRLFNIS